jgi:hypothetical protein
VPGLEGRVGGLGIQVASPAVCLLDITVRLEKEDADYAAVTAAVKKASEGSLAEVLGWTEQPLVSSDFRGEQRSAVVDLAAGLQLQPGMVKLIVWYDCETGFAARLVDLVLFMQVPGAPSGSLWCIVHPLADCLVHSLPQASDQDRAPSRESSIASDNYASSVCLPSHRAKCEQCLKWRDLCPYCRSGTHGQETAGLESRDCVSSGAGRSVIFC